MSDLSMAIPAAFIVLLALALVASVVVGERHDAARRAAQHPDPAPTDRTTTGSPE